MSVSILLSLAACDEDGEGVVATPDAGGSVAGGPPTAAEEPSAPFDAGAFGFRRDVYPIFGQYCGDCHSVNGPYHDIASPDLTEAYADAVEFAERIVIRIEQGSMPPTCVFDDAACVPAEALATIERWIASGEPE